MSNQTTSGKATANAGSNAVGVQELIDQLKSDGVSRGQAEAEALISDARKQSMAILDDAKKEAAEVLTKAKQEAKQIEENGKQALALASRDATLKLKESFQHEFRKRFGKLVSFTLQDNEFLKQLILEVARRSVPADDQVPVEVLLPASKVGHDQLEKNIDEVQPNTLSHFVLGLMADQLREGVTFGAADTFTEGVRVRLVESDVEVDLTDETVSALLMRFLAPRFRVLVDSTS